MASESSIQRVRYHKPKVETRGFLWQSQKESRFSAAISHIDTILNGQTNQATRKNAVREILQGVFGDIPYTNDSSYEIISRVFQTYFRRTILSTSGTKVLAYLAIHFNPACIDENNGTINIEETKKTIKSFFNESDTIFIDDKAIKHMRISKTNWQFHFGEKRFKSIQNNLGNYFHQEHMNKHISSTDDECFLTPISHLSIDEMDVIDSDEESYFNENVHNKLTLSSLILDVNSRASQGQQYIIDSYPNLISQSQQLNENKAQKENISLKINNLYQLLTEDISIFKKKKNKLLLYTSIIQNKMKEFSERNISPILKTMSKLNSLSPYYHLTRNLNQETQQNSSLQGSNLNTTKNPENVLISKILIFSCEKYELKYLNLFKGKPLDSIEDKIIIEFVMDLFEKDKDFTIQNIFPIIKEIDNNREKFIFHFLSKIKKNNLILHGYYTNWNDKNILCKESIIRIYINSLIENSWGMEEENLQRLVHFQSILFDFLDMKRSIWVHISGLYNIQPLPPEIKQNIFPYLNEANISSDQLRYFINMQNLESKDQVKDLKKQLIYTLNEYESWFNINKEIKLSSSVNEYKILDKEIADKEEF